MNANMASNKTYIFENKFQEHSSYLIRMTLTLQRWGTFKLLPSLWTEEFEFPTSSALL